MFLKLCFYILHSCNTLKITQNNIKVLKVLGRLRTAQDILRLVYNLRLTQDSFFKLSLDLRFLNI